MVAEPGHDEAARLLVPLGAQRGEWEATREGRIEILSGPIPADGAGSASVDVLVFPGSLLGGLVDVGALAAIPDEAALPPAAPGADFETGPTEPPEDLLALADVLPVYRDQVMTYGNQRLAVPLGGSALVLVYRRDAFERDENRTAATEAGITLQPPQTYEELDALARFFQGRDWDGDGEAESGIALALGDGPEGVGVATYLARAAALGLHPDYYAFLIDDDTMEPELTTPPLVEALEGLVALASSGPAEVADYDAEAARTALREGRAALLIDRAEMAARWTDPAEPFPVGVAALPGSRRLFDPDRQSWQDLDRPNRPTVLPRGGGWLAGLSAAAEGRQRDAALDFLRYLAGPETTARLLADRDAPMLPTRTSQLGLGLPDPRSAPGVDSRGWSDAVAATLTAQRIVPGLRIPEAGGYLDDLRRHGLRPAVAEGVPAGSALETVARAWSERTEQLGKERQLWHYRSSLGRRTRTTTPPPRPSAPSGPPAAG